jgi:uncharacterized Zn finger protein
MKQADIDAIKDVIRSHWPYTLDAKARRYLNGFFDRTRVGNKIAAKVVGNHGTYTVSIEAKGGEASATCSCYIGRDGHCHHCDALAHTFLDDPESFQIMEQKELGSVRTPEDLQAYLKGVTLDSLIKDLKAQGITQKQFAESIGMNARQLSAIKASELRNRFFNELGAVKLACLWMLERFEKVEWRSARPPDNQMKRTRQKRRAG